MKQYGSLAFFVAFVLLPLSSNGDQFDNAISSLRLQSSANDFSGASVRGGANFSTGTTGTTTLFRGQAQVSGGCGSFSFASSFKDAMDNIPEIIKGFSTQIISELPMVLIAYASPTLADIGKHVQSVLNVLIQARFAQCHASQNSAMYLGLRLRGGQVSRCLEDRHAAGDSISAALEICNSTAFDLRAPDGSPRREVHLIEDTLSAAGATTETQGLATALLGDVTLRAGEQFGIDSRRPTSALLGRYETHRTQYQAALAAATDELQQTGTVTVTTLRAVSVPGQPMPRAAVNALAGLRVNPARYEAAVGRLSTSMALTHLTWECGDLEEQLAAAADGNPHLSDEERKSLEQRFQALRRNLAQVVARAEAGEKYGAALDKVLEEYARVEATATDLALRAPAVQIPPSPYGAQLPLGYSK